MKKSLVALSLAFGIVAVAAVKIAPPLLKRTISGHANSVAMLDLSDDGRIIATGDFDNIVKVWDYTSGRELYSFTAHDENLLDLDISPDGNILATGGFDQKLKIWNLADGRLLKTLVPPHDELMALKRFPPELHKNLHNMFPVYDQFRWVFATRFSPEGKYLLTGSGDNTITVWNTDDWSIVNTIRKFDRMGRTLAFSRDGTILATSGCNDEISIETVGNTTTHTTVGCGQHKAILFSVPDGREIREMDEWYNQAYSDLKFTSNSKYLIGCSSLHVMVWDVATGKIVRKFMKGTEESYRIMDFTSLLFMKDENVIIAGDSYNYIHYYDIARGVELLQFKAHQGSTYGMAMTPDKKFIVTGGEDKLIKIWELR